MLVQLIKTEKGMIPAKKVDGKWVPDLDSKIVYDEDGIHLDRKEE